MIDDSVIVVIGGVLGAVIGSFLNVCILRWPVDESVVRPPSRCPGCGSAIAWYDNIPVLSWLILRGKCRHCGTRISIQYPLIELATALIWASMAWRGPTQLEALRAATFFTILLGIAMTDARHYIIPDEFSLGGLVLGILFSLPGGFREIGQALIGAGTGYVLLWGVGAAGRWMFKEEAMGGGDIKMMAMVGAFIGWKGVILTIFLGALLGTIVFVPLALLGKKKLVPFGVFLSLGAAVTFLIGPAVIQWYRDYIGAA